MNDEQYTALLKEQLGKYDDETRHLEFKSNYHQDRRKENVDVGLSSLELLELQRTNGSSTKNLVL